MTIEAHWRTCLLCSSAISVDSSPGSPWTLRRLGQHLAGRIAARRSLDWLAGSRGSWELGPAGGERAGLKDLVSVRYSPHHGPRPSSLISGIPDQCGIVTWPEGMRREIATAKVRCCGRHRHYTFGTLGKKGRTRALERRRCNELPA